MTINEIRAGWKFRTLRELDGCVYNKRFVIRLVEKCSMKDVGSLSPIQAAEAMKQIVIGCLKANLTDILGKVDP